MKTLRAALPVLLLLGCAAQAQEAATAPATAAPPANAEAITVPLGALRTAEQLEQLLAPIALYPDALIAIILPASTTPTDIVLAARHLRDFPNDRSQIEHRAWDESVKSLTHYPEVVQWLDENLTWTKQVGEAFLAQPADVMETIQRLRARARTAGTLVDTPQQQVLAEPDVIRIVPAQPEIIYVPRYEPEVVFLPAPVYYTQPAITFGLGVRAGSWLAYDCDWRRKSIWVGDRHRHWRGHDWRRPVVPIAPGVRHVSKPGIRQWRPSTRVTFTHRSTEIARPSIIGRPHGHEHSSHRTWSSSSRNHSIIRRPTPAVAGPIQVPAPRSFGARSLPPSRTHVAPPPAQLYVTDRGGTPANAPAATLITPPSSPRSHGHWNRDRSSHSRPTISRPSARPAQPVMGPRPPATAAFAPSSGGPRLASPSPSPRAHSGPRLPVGSEPAVSTSPATPTPAAREAASPSPAPRATPGPRFGRGARDSQR